MSQVRACNRLRTSDSVDFFETVDADVVSQSFMLNAVVDVSGIEVMKQSNGPMTFHLMERQDGEHRSENTRVSELTNGNESRLKFQVLGGLRQGNNSHSPTRRNVSHGTARTTHRDITLSTRCEERGNTRTRCSGVMAVVPT